MWYKSRTRKKLGEGRGEELPPSGFHSEIEGSGIPALNSTLHYRHFVTILELLFTTISSAIVYKHLTRI